MKIRKGDQVLIVKGKDRGKRAKVLRGFPKENKVLVEGVNIRKLHKRPKKEGEKGQVVEVPTPIDVSKIKVVCSKCGKPTKIGYEARLKGKIQKQVSSHSVASVTGSGTGSESKIRICKKCNQVL